MKKGEIGKILGIVLVLAMLGVVIGGLPTGVVNDVAAADGVVTFPDANLEAAIRDAISKPAGDIYQSDLEALTTLDASSRGITNIAGLEYCGSLEELDLYQNQISDISLLSGLTNLQELWLQWNQISDISPLSGLTNLEKLYLYNNQISDISPLSSLTNLETLYLEGNEVGDIGPLSGLTNLQELWLQWNQISDISPLSGLTNLEKLYLDGNEISDISPLSGLTSLEWLHFFHNQISDISPLSGLTSLEWLFLEGNEVSDISPLSGLTNLQRLRLDRNQVSDISSLSGLTNLKLLRLEDNQISDISALAGLTELGLLLLDYNQIADISAISGLTKLGEGTWFPEREGIPICLGLRSNQVADINPLVQNAGLANGDGIDLRENSLSAQSYNTYIPQLEARGVNVLYDAAPPTPLDPTISFSPTSLSFAASEGGANPADQTLNIWNSGGGTLNWSVADDAAWLGLNPPNGASTGEHDAVTVSVDISGMGAGSYSGTITISDLAATNNPQTAQVNLTINPAGAGINWSLPYGTEAFLCPTPANGRPYIDASVALPTGTEPVELLGVYWLDEATGVWNYFNPNFTVNTLNSLEPGQAYLVAVSDSCVWNLPCGEGVGLPTGSIWNFPSTSVAYLAPTSANNRPYLGAAVSLPTGTEPVELLGVFWLDEATRVWNYFNPNFTFNTLNSLEPDQAYLVAVDGACSWQLS